MDLQSRDNICKDSHKTVLLGKKNTRKAADLPVQVKQEPDCGNESSKNTTVPHLSDILKQELKDKDAVDDAHTIVKIHRRRSASKEPSHGLNLLHQHDIKLWETTDTDDGSESQTVTMRMSSDMSTVVLIDNSFYCDKCKLKYDTDSLKQGLHVCAARTEVSSVGTSEDLNVAFQNVHNLGTHSTKLISDDSFKHELLEMTSAHSGSQHGAVIEDISSGNLSENTSLISALKEKSNTKSVMAEKKVSVGKLQNTDLIKVKPYKCDICDGVFSHRSNLRTHKMKHSSERPFKCDMCGAGFLYSSKLKVHKMTHSKEKPYTCDICGIGFTYRCKLKRHKIIHSEDKPYTCDICGVGFSYSCKLKIHKMSHTGEKPYKCDICDAGFTQNGNLKRHIMQHTGEKPFVCDDCGIGFSQYSHLKKHKIKHAEEEATLYGSLEPESSLFILPIVKQEGGTPNSDVFDEKMIKNLEIYRRKFTGAKPYRCEICGIGFYQRGHLKLHIVRHTGEKPYKCSICSEAFVSSSQLLTHEMKHTGEKLFKCDVCGVGFTLYCNLYRHKRLHTGEKPYVCDICGVGYTQSTQLKGHRMIHTGERPFKCDVCGVGFTLSSNLRAHKRVHTGEKPYKCNICYMEFTQSGTLKTHSRTHTGERPFRCDICGAGFSQSTTMKAHTLRHMEENSDAVVKKSP